MRHGLRNMIIVIAELFTLDIITHFRLFCVLRLCLSHLDEL